MFWNIFWKCLDFVLDFLECFGLVLEVFSKCLSTCFDNVLGMFCECFGNVARIFCFFGNALEML